jgi:hypothetical protein
MTSIQEQIRAYGIQPVPVAERQLGFADTGVPTMVLFRPVLGLRGLAVGN